MFADAFAALGDAYANAGFHNTIVPGEAIPLARRASMRAIELDPGQSQAHGTIGAIAFFFDHDWTTAEAAFQRAIVANPSYAGVHQWLALGLTSRGRFEEAESQSRTALALDPLSYAVSNDLAVVYSRAPVRRGGPAQPAVAGHRPDLQPRG